MTDDQEPEEPAGKTDPVGRPVDMEKAIATAYLRMMGATQERAAEGAGASVRSIQSWEKCSWWDDAREAARKRWMKDLTDSARKGLTQGVKDDGTLALRVLERVDPELAPPKMQAEIGGVGGGPIEVNVTKRVIDPRSDEE